MKTRKSWKRNFSASFIRNHPAMKIGDSLVISDLHIGITRDIWEKGVSIPSQIKKMAERVNCLKKVTRTRRLVILGDVKHRIPVASFQEEREVPDFLSLVKFNSIVIVKGNHDGEIEGMVGKIPVKKSISIGNYCLTHGHRKVLTKKKKIVIGHNQPHVRLKDDMGAVYIEPTWVNGVLKNGKELVIMPAFNELCGASIVNGQKFIGPVAKNIIPGETRVYLLDGTDLGTVDKLPRFEKNL